eukprot:gnl/Trimastix_PCT/4490.p1 GENE.gnl/Trimastix_PCT/4490~~gnl/Trimastix_PCT/4490.p1  ORF type:complete len:207 (-),score=34.97 gnl/Trimastix_PCT/4490:36-656(-)
MEAKKKVNYKIIFLGDSGTGKTTMIERIMTGAWNDKSEPTFGASFALKEIMYHGTRYTAGLWDTAGQERFDCLSSFYCRGAHAAIVCYSLTDSRSRIQHWVEKARRESGVDNMVIVLAGTKRDLLETTARAFEAEEIEGYRAAYHALHFETSSKTGEQVTELITTAVAQLSERMPIAVEEKAPARAQPSESVSLSSKPSNHKSCAC